MGGRYTVSLILAHILLIIWGYALTAHTSVVSETGTLVLNYPDMLKATAGSLLLLATGVISAAWRRRKMSYETWHYLHFRDLRAIFLAFGHQLANGADFVGNQTAQTAWYVMYLGVSALLVWFRFLVPLRRARAPPAAGRRGAARVARGGVRLSHRGAAGRARRRARPVLRWRFLAPGLWWTANPYSLSAPAHPRYLRVTVKAVGTHSAALTRLAPGTKVWAEGPYGGFTGPRATGRKDPADRRRCRPSRRCARSSRRCRARSPSLYRARRAEDLAAARRARRDRQGAGQPDPVRAGHAEVAHRTAHRPRPDAARSRPGRT